MQSNSDCSIMLSFYFINEKFIEKDKFRFL